MCLLKNNLGCDPNSIYLFSRESSQMLRLMLTIVETEKATVAGGDRIENVPVEIIKKFRGLHLIQRKATESGQGGGGGELQV